MLVTELTLDDAFRWMCMREEMAVDVETTGLSIWGGDRVIGIAVSDAETAFYFPFGHNEGYNLPRKHLPDVYKAISDCPHLITWNGKFDLQAMRQDGFERDGGWEDVMLSAHLMNENEESFALKRIADKYFGAGTSADETELTRQIKSRFGQKAKKGEIWRLPSEVVAPYACSDTLLTYRLRDFYRPHLEEWSLSELNEEVQQYNNILNQIESYGVRMDVDWIREAQAKAGPRMDQIKREIDALVGYEINPQSPIQLREYLGTSGTSKEILETLDDPVAALVLEFRAQKKVSGTYLTNYLEMMDENHDIHATFNPHGTVAGRLSSSNPNLQNVPKFVRRAFIARPGNVIVEIDYRAAEMRLAAHYSRAPKLVQIFREDGDPHQLVADEMTAIMGSQVTRQQGKIINFGKIYGMAAAGFSKKFDITYEEAQRYVEAYDDRFPEIRDLYYSMQNKAANDGYIRLPTGRVRRYHNGRFQTAMNNLIQGTAAEVVRYSMMRLNKQVPEAQMLLQVHDSIMFEIPEGSIDELIPRIVSIMEDFQFDPPMRVDVSVGPSWGTLEEYVGY